MRYGLFPSHAKLDFCITELIKLTESKNPNILNYPNPIKQKLEAWSENNVERESKVDLHKAPQRGTIKKLSFTLQTIIKHHIASPELDFNQHNIKAF